LKEKQKRGEVKIKSEGDPTKFNELTKSSQTTPSGNTGSATTPSGDANYYPSTPSVEVINGSSDSAVSQGYTDTNTMVDSKNVSERYKNDPAFSNSNSANSPAAPAATRNNSMNSDGPSSTPPSSGMTNQSDMGLTQDTLSRTPGSTPATMPAGDYKYKQEGDETKIKTPEGKLKEKKDEVKYKAGDEKIKEKKDEVKIKEGGDKIKEKKDEVKIKEGGEKIKEKKDEVKIKEADGAKYKQDGGETKVKAADGSKVKANENEYKYKKGEQKKRKR